MPVLARLECVMAMERELRIRAAAWRRASLRKAMGVVPVWPDRPWTVRVCQL